MIITKILMKFFFMLKPEESRAHELERPIIEIMSTIAELFKVFLNKPERFLVATSYIILSYNLGFS